MTHKSLLASMTQLELAVWAAFYAQQTQRERESTADPDAARIAASIAADEEVMRLRAVTFRRAVADDLAASKQTHNVRPNGVCSCGYQPPADQDPVELMQLHLNAVGALGYEDIKT